MASELKNWAISQCVAKAMIDIPQTEWVDAKGNIQFTSVVDSAYSIQFAAGCLLHHALALPADCVGSFIDVFLRLRKDQSLGQRVLGDIKKLVQSEWGKLMEAPPCCAGREIPPLLGLISDMFPRKALHPKLLPSVVEAAVSSFAEHSHAGYLIEWGCGLVLDFCARDPSPSQLRDGILNDCAEALGDKCLEVVDSATRSRQLVSLVRNLKDNSWKGIMTQVRCAPAEEAESSCSIQAVFPDGLTVEIDASSCKDAEDIKRHLSDQFDRDVSSLITLWKDSRSEICLLFHERGLPIAAAFQLVDPNGQYDFEDLPTLAEFVKEKDLREVGLKVAPARKLLRDLRPDGAIHNALVLSNRLRIDSGNPNDGSTSSDWASCTNTDLTSVHVPQSVKQRIVPVARQLHLQEKLARQGLPNTSLFAAGQQAHERGLLNDEEHARLTRINHQANRAKHDFGCSGARHSWE